MGCYFHLEHPPPRELSGLSLLFFITFLKCCLLGEDLPNLFTVPHIPPLTLPIALPTGS